jgi:hypothetical protein
VGPSKVLVPLQSERGEPYAGSSVYKASLIKVVSLGPWFLAVQDAVWSWPEWILVVASARRAPPVVGCSCCGRPCSLVNKCSRFSANKCPP